MKYWKVTEDRETKPDNKESRISGSVCQKDQLLNSSIYSHCSRRDKNSPSAFLRKLNSRQGHRPSKVDETKCWRGGIWSQVKWRWPFSLVRKPDKNFKVTSTFCHWTAFFSFQVFLNRILNFGINFFVDQNEFCPEERTMTRRRPFADEKSKWGRLKPKPTKRNLWLQFFIDFSIKNSDRKISAKRPIYLRLSLTLHSCRRFWHRLRSSTISLITNRVLK